MAFTGVTTTGIYCRPGCGARPNAENRRSFPTAAAAEAAGFRACFQCRPYRAGIAISPDAPELVCRGVQLILDGMLDEHSESDLARKLGVSSRHLRRLFLTELGATPDQLARSARAHFARRLLDDTDLSITEIAFAAGFGSIRQFNRIMHDTFRAPPRELRAKRRRSDRLVADGGLPLRVPLAEPIDWTGTLQLLATTAIPGVEHVGPTVYRRTIVIEGAPGVVEVVAGGRDELVVTVHLPFWTGLIHVVQRVRHIFNLDLDDAEAERQLLLVRGEEVRVPIRPGLRPPGTWDPFETAVAAVLGEGRDAAAARHVAGRLVATFGAAVPGLAALDLSHTFPAPADLIQADLTAVGISSRRSATIRSLA